MVFQYADKLNHKVYGFSDEDMNKVFPIPLEFQRGLFEDENKQWKLKEIIELMKHFYCGKISYEYYHITDFDEREFIRDRVEREEIFHTSPERKLEVLKRLAKVHSFTDYLKNKFSTAKRFGVEGCDSAIASLDYLVDYACRKGVKGIAVGMPHRGRLETLACVFEKPMEQILAEFQEIKPSEIESYEPEWGNSGDVKYHLGSNKTRILPDGKAIQMSILANPSHLEAVNPVVTGHVRSQQDYYEDEKRSMFLPVIIHGDASICGQGVVYETIQMSGLRYYSVGGTIHIVINNQIGFTTVPRHGRSGLHPTDIAKTSESFIIHVNADEPELVDKAMELALDYRQKFKKDVIINVIGYRRHGHNELDQPSFTQPMMYKAIEKQPPVFNKYCDELLAQGVVKKEAIDQLMGGLMQMYEIHYENSRNKKFHLDNWHSVVLEETKKPVTPIKNQIITSITDEKFEVIGEKICTIPGHFPVHSGLKRIYQQRLNSIREGVGIDWATAEALAFASLITESYHVRLSGQDVERGTFSHRHAILHSQNDDSKYIPIHSVLTERSEITLRPLKEFIVCNSPLSEFGVLGFEYGYSLANPNMMVLWEAQFGDFANGAQIMIDNFISSGESKWGTKSGIVLLLPHGFDGQGPEHSSCRIERFLELADDPYDVAKYQKLTNEDRIKTTNMIVALPSTSANYFHLLRRQMKRDFRKPLIVASPKRLLRYKGATCKKEEFTEVESFTNVYPETFPEEINEPEQVERVLFCAGEVYYDLLEYRRKHGIKDTAIVRIEQLAPFPHWNVKPIVQKYQNPFDS
jgi:2-oxoglutarate dehydrogenase E1 component